MEQDNQIIVKAMLLAIGENLEREGLKDTPARVVKMWKELFRGYDELQKPKVTVFENNTDGLHYDQIITDSGYYWSYCEHHMVPFFGTYNFGYIPNGKVLGLSKVARIVDFYAAKLQVQERLTKEIVDELETALTHEVSASDVEKGFFQKSRPQAIGLVLKGRHLCKEMRGVKKINGEMITSDLRGKFKTEPETRAEFLQFIK